jgi:hypothetical protein
MILELDSEEDSVSGKDPKEYAPRQVQTDINFENFYEKLADEF